MVTHSMAHTSALAVGARSCTPQRHTQVARVMVASHITRRSRQAMVPRASSENLAPATNPSQDLEVRYLTKRAKHVTDNFDSALGVDDFMQRLEIALWGYGFRNDNSIGEHNLFSAPTFTSQLEIAILCGFRAKLLAIVRTSHLTQHPSHPCPYCPLCWACRCFKPAPNLPYVCLQPW